MRRRRRFDLQIVIFIFLVTVGYFTYNHITSEGRGINAYQKALEVYKNLDYENAYQEFTKVPSASTLKKAALFRQARCATNMGKKELAIKKYDKIIHLNSKSSIVPISEYNMAILLMDVDEKKAKKHFKNIIKKHPTSDYAIASEYYLGKLELKNISDDKKNKNKIIDNSANHFRAYLQHSPDGRFAMKSIDELLKLKVHLTNYDNLVIAKALYENGEYEKSREYLNKTTISESWTDFVKTEYKLGNKDKVVYYTELGLKEYAFTSEQKDVFEVIDNYISTFSTRKDGINSLVAKQYNSVGADYIEYLNCNENISSNKETCYANLYQKYPNGQFSADALYNLFLIKYLQKKYYDAQRFGFLHLSKFPNVKSSPAVTYYMGRIATKLKHYESGNSYYKQVLEKYPDTYYAYRAHYNLYKSDGALPFSSVEKALPVVFPYMKSRDNSLVVKLALLKDYDLVEELCKKDKFVQSWIAYQKGNYTISAILARNAMDELVVKPDFNALEWRLVYPLHYINLVEKYKQTNNPLIIQAIIKEESHFNPNATSYVGASGLMQLMPSTFSEIKNNYKLNDEIYSPECNIQAGSVYYQNLKKVLGNKDLYAISAYNGGIGSVTNWFSKIIYNDMDEFVEQIPYPETKNYVKKVLRSYWMYGNIY